MWGGRRWRERALREQRLREECLQLRYVLAHWQARSRSPGELEALLRRVYAARENLRPVIYAHDDSPGRWARFGVGVIAAGAGLVGISTANPAGLASAGLGIALIVDESRSILSARLDLQRDQDLLEMLGRMQQRILDDLEALGIRTPPRF
jgi:hypothetical protein